MRVLLRREEHVGTIEDTVVIGAKRLDLLVHLIELREVERDLLVQFERPAESPPDLREATVVHRHDRFDRVAIEHEDAKAEAEYVAHVLEVGDHRIVRPVLCLVP